MISKVFKCKSKVCAFQPKSINFYFPDSINPELKLINLTNLAAVNFYIKKDEENSLHILAANMNSHNHVQDINIASFKSKEEAEKALSDTHLALYRNTGSCAKWFSLLAFAGILTCAVLFHLSGNEMQFKLFNNKNTTSQKEVATSQPTSTNPSAGSVPNYAAGIITPPMPVNIDPKDIPPPVSDGEIDNIIGQLQQVKQLQEVMKQKQGNPQNVQQPETQPNPAEQQANPAEQFLKGLN